MKNKFEALKAFQSWPREWQELCAEYWASDDEPKASVWTTSDKLATVGQLMQAGPQVAAKAASMQGCKPIYRGDFGIAEQEHLAKCHCETRTRREAAYMFLERFPGRTCQAVEIKIRKMLDANGVMHVRY